MKSRPGKSLSADQSHSDKKSKISEQQQHHLQMQSELLKLQNPAKAKVQRTFFKTAPGEYAEGDEFLGITMPQLRRLAQDFMQMPLPEIALLLRGKWHEERMSALIILTRRYELAQKNTDGALQAEIVRLYLENTANINNWDLVDVSAHKILGAHYFPHHGQKLLDLSQSTHLWEQRISIVASWAFIRQNKLDLTFRLSRHFLPHQHDLIHKAVGWMLREAGKKDKQQLQEFLLRHHQRMPRTMLRYALEKFSSKEKAVFMAKPKAKAKANKVKSSRIKK